MTDDEIQACRDHYDLPYLPDRTVVKLCSDSNYLAFYRFNNACTKFGKEIMKVLLPFGRK